MKWLARRKVIPVEIILEQLASLLAAGVSITRSLDILEKAQPDMIARLRLYKIKQALLSGHALHLSMQSAPEWFDTYAIKLVALGEQTGKLDLILMQLAQHYANKHAQFRKLRGLLFYPCMILISAILMTAAMFIFVIPAFADMFRDSQQALPWLTKLLFHVSTFFNQWLIPCALLTSTGIMLVFVLQKKTGAILIRVRLTDLPPLSRILQTIYIIRYTRHLALALSAGMPILHALQVCGDLAENITVTRQCRHLRNAVTAGASMYQAIEPLTLFPPLLKQMIKTGEESGHLDALLTKAAELLESELQNSVAKFTAMLEPLIMVILGALIGGIVVGMYLPVFNLGSVL